MTDFPFTLEEFKALYKKCLPSLRSIVYKTKGEYTLEDLWGELWVEACDLLEEGKYGSISSPEFQEKIPGYLFNRLHKWAEKTVRYAHHIDDKGDDEDSAKNYWLDAATASPEDDPLARLCRYEEMQEKEQQLEERLNASYSEAVAYIRLLQNFASNRKAIAKHLALFWGWVWCKMKCAQKWVKRQCSLFNANGNTIEVIEKNFVPPPSKLEPRKILPWRKRAALCHQQRLLQKKLFSRMYVPIRAVEN